MLEKYPAGCTVRSSGLERKNEDIRLAFHVRLCAAIVKLMAIP